MNALRSPKHKLYAAIGLLTALGLVASTRGFDMVSGARWLVAGVLLVGLGFWMVRQRSRTAGFKPLPRLNVLARTGLSPKCSLALVEADGRTLLIAFGDGFAQFADSPAALKTKAPRIQGRRAAPKSRRSRKVVSP